MWDEGGASGRWVVLALAEQRAALASESSVHEGSLGGPWGLEQV